MKMTKFGYFSEFLLFPPLILLASLFAFRSSIPPQPALWVIVYGGALICWTLIEYLLHRVLFHHAPVLAEIHESHHNSPQDLIGTPAWASMLLGLIAIACPSWALFGFDLATAVTAGLVTGYLWYVLVHYATHHWRPRMGTYFYRAHLRHARHHHLSHNGNFGVTTDVWDRVFGTVLDQRPPRVREGEPHYFCGERRISGSEQK